MHVLLKVKYHSIFSLFFVCIQFQFYVHYHQSLADFF
jgi:hypothetical protein